MSFFCLYFYFHEMLKIEFIYPEMHHSCGVNMVRLSIKLLFYQSACLHVFWQGFVLRMCASSPNESSGAEQRTAFMQKQSLIEEQNINTLKLTKRARASERERIAVINFLECLLDNCTHILCIKIPTEQSVKSKVMRNLGSNKE